MRVCSIFVLSLLTIVAPTMFLRAQASKVPNQTDDRSPQRAKMLWEQALAAKGGRERLYAVRNFVVSSKSRFRFSPRPDVAAGIAEESLYVFPGKWWNFFDYRPGKMGYGINVLDLERGIRWYASPGKKVPLPPRPDLDKSIIEGFEYRFRQAQFLYLLETKWAKPTFIGARTESVGHKNYDVVETVIADREMRRLVREGPTKRLQVEVIDNERAVRADFYLDRKTHLPARIVIDGSAARGSGKGSMDYVCRLDDYANVGGIQMPQIVNCGDKENQTTYQFNVDYDEAIFERPPTSADAKPDAWRAAAR